MEETRATEREEDRKRRQGKKEKQRDEWPGRRKREALKRGERKTHGEREKAIKYRYKEVRDPAWSWGFLQSPAGTICAAVWGPNCSVSASTKLHQLLSKAITPSRTHLVPWGALPVRGAQCPCWWCSPGLQSWSHGWNTCCPQSAEAWPSLLATCHCRDSAALLLPPPPPSPALRLPAPPGCSVPPLHWLLHPPALSQCYPGLRAFWMLHALPCGIGGSWWDQRLLSQRWAGPSPEEGSQESCAAGKALEREMVLLKENGHEKGIPSGHQLGFWVFRQGNWAF